MEYIEDDIQKVSTPPTVPANKQCLFALPIRVDGDLVITGDLIMVN